MWRRQKDWNKPWLSSWQSDPCQTPISTLRYSPFLILISITAQGPWNKQKILEDAPPPPRKRPFPLPPQGGLQTSQCRELNSKVKHSPSTSFSASPPRSNPTMSPNGVSGLKMACNTAWSFGVPMMLKYENPKRWLRMREEGGRSKWWVVTELHSQLI